MPENYDFLSWLYGAILAFVIAYALWIVSRNSTNYQTCDECKGKCWKNGRTCDKCHGLGGWIKE